MDADSILPARAGNSTVSEQGHWNTGVPVPQESLASTWEQQVCGEGMR